MRWHTILKIVCIVLTFSLLITAASIQLDSTSAQDGTTTETQNMDLVRRMIERLWGTEYASPEEVAEFYAPRFYFWSEEQPSAAWVRGWEDAGLNAYSVCFPDHELVIENIFASGDIVFVHYTFQGTFDNWGMSNHYTGTGEPIIPTHKNAMWSGVFVYRIEDDKIVEEWWYWNKGLTNQLGLTEPSSWGKPLE